jgi:DNA polymerase lambda
MHMLLKEVRGFSSLILCIAVEDCPLAMAALRRHPTRIKTEQEARQIRNIGEKTARKIIQVLNTGHMDRLRYEESTPEAQACKIFLGIYGIGPALAREWFQRGLRTLDDVKNGKDGVKLTPNQEVCYRFPD